MPGPSPVDQLGRPLRSLRVSVTDRCNLRCQYCMPAALFGPDFRFLPRSEILRYEEITRLAKVFVEIGVREIRVTGGEPLLRRDLPVLISQLRGLDASLDLSLTTNGMLLDRMAGPLRDAGLDRLNVSLDALDPEVAGRLAGRPVDPEVIWENILLARRTGFEVKVNTVLKGGVNSGEAVPLARRCREAGITLRFIEYMDVGESNRWSADSVVPGREVLGWLRENWILLPATDQSVHETARRYRYGDGAGEVGFINSITEPFCRGCDRARVSSEGKLYTCLFASDGIALKSWLREEGVSDEELRKRLLKVWGRRDDRYSERRREPAGSPAAGRPEMWTIGG